MIETIAYGTDGRQAADDLEHAIESMQRTIDEMRAGVPEAEHYEESSVLVGGVVDVMVRPVRLAATR